MDIVEALAISLTPSTTLRDMGFTSTASDPYVYIFGSDDNLSIVTMYVDNPHLLGGDTPLLEDIKCQLMSLFTVIDMVDVSMVLGTIITRDRDAKSLTISQEHYARSVPARFSMEKTTQCTRLSRNVFSSSRTRCC